MIAGETDTTTAGRNAVRTEGAQFIGEYRFQSAERM